MIGSKRKREEVFHALEAEGVSRTRLDAVYSPIGLQIGAESPEEIAVSITAELIQMRVKHLKTKPSNS
jgi:xanthine dehydrogenase accessory factor